MITKFINEVVDTFERVTPSFASQSQNIAENIADNVCDFFSEHGEEIVDGAIEITKGIFGGS